MSQSESSIAAPPVSASTTAPAAVPGSPFGDRNLTHFEARDTAIPIDAPRGIAPVEDKSAAEVAARDREVMREDRKHLRNKKKRHTCRDWVGTPRGFICAWRKYLAEFIGTMLFVFLGLWSVVASVGRIGSVDIVSILVIGFAFGLALATMIFVCSRISGGHLNPAVTLAILVAMKMTLLEALGYIIAQLLGAVVGAAFVLALAPFDLGQNCGWGATVPVREAYFMRAGATTASVYEIVLVQAFFLEFILTFILVFTVFATAGVASNSRSMGRFAPLSIGFAVFVCVMIAMPFTGGSLNPARSFGAAVISGIWHDHWIYWVAPILGGILAGLVYKYAFVRREEGRDAVPEEKEVKDYEASPDKQQENSLRTGA